MPFVVSPHSLEWPVHDIGSYVKPIHTCKLEHVMINDHVHSSLLVVFQKKIVQSVVTTIGSIVETQTPSHRLRYDGDIGFQTSITGRGVALVMGPPTVWVTARVVDTGPVARGGTVGNIVWKLGVDSGVDARKKLLGFCVSGKDGSSLPNSRERGCNLGHGGITVGCTFGGDVYVNHCGQPSL